MLQDRRGGLDRRLHGKMQVARRADVAGPRTEEDPPMSRRSTVSLLASMTLAIMIAAPASAAKTSTKVEPLPLVQGHVIENVCEFPVEYTDRGGRVLTTRYDRAGRMVSQTISGTSIVELTNLATTTTESFEIDEVTDDRLPARRHRQRGAARVVGHRDRPGHQHPHPRPRLVRRARREPGHPRSDRSCSPTSRVRRGSASRATSATSS